MKKKLIFVVLTGFLIAGCGVGDLKKEGHLVMEALKEGNAEKSYQLLHPALQKAIGELDGWKKWAENRKPTSWTFNGFQVKAGGAGQLTGEATFSTGQKLDIELNFAKDGGQYKLVGIDFGKTDDKTKRE